MKQSWIEWKDLPKKTASSNALIFNEQGKILVVKPSYKQTWNLPGGIIEEEESPQDACKREVLEELGIAIVPRDLAFVIYESRSEKLHDNIRFVWKIEKVSPDQIANIKLQESELADYKFIDLFELNDYLDFRLAEPLRKIGNATLYIQI